MARLVCCVFLAVVLAGCAGHKSFRSAFENGSVPRYLELAEGRSIATFHFPAGLYAFELADKDGYYYRALKRVVNHSFAGPITQNAGIFVSKSNGKVRGYVVWAGGRTRIGNLSRAPIRYRDSITR